MKNVVISVDKPSTQKFLLELAAKLGLSAKVETQKEMQWNFMPDDNAELEAMISKAEKNIRSGKFLTAEQAAATVKKWK